MKSIIPFILFISVVFGMFPLQGYGQKSNFRGELYVGAGGGVLFAKTDFVPSIAQDSRMGFHAGIAAKYISQKHVGLIAEINFAQRGWKEKFEDNPNQYAYSRALNYLEIPILTHVYVGDKIRFILNAGPQISFLLSNSAAMNDALKADVDAAKIKNTEQYKEPQRRFDYGIIGGIGVAFQTPIGNFDLEGRYYLGFGDVFDSRISTKSYFSRSASRIIEAKLTYYMKL